MNVLAFLESKHVRLKATCSSAVPLAIGTGAGHELRQPLGIASVGGLLAAQVLTLCSTPVIYLLIARLRLGDRRARPV